MKAKAILLILCLLYGSLAASTRQIIRGRDGTLAPTEASTPALLEVNAASESKATTTTTAKLDVLRSTFPQAVATSGSHKNAQPLAVEATGPPPLTANWGIVSDSFGKSRLNFDFGAQTLANAIAIQNGQGCYYGTSQFRLYGSNEAGDFSNILYPGISSSMYPLGMYTPSKWTTATPKCDAASAATFNPTEEILTLADIDLATIKRQGGFRFYVILFDDTYGSVNPDLNNYFAVKHIAIQSPRTVADAYPFYKFVFTQTRSQASASTTGAQSNGVGGTITNVQTPIQLSEVRMWTDLRWVAPVQGLTTNPGGYWSTNFEPSRATDNLPETAWRDNNMRGQQSELHLVFSSAISFTFYEIITAPDEQSMDPSSWTLYGSNDQHAWIMLDVRRKFDMPTDRKASQKFEIDIKNYPTSPVFVGGVGTKLADSFMSYLYSIQPGVPALNMYKDPSNSYLTDGIITAGIPQEGVVVGWPSTANNPTITFDFGRGKRVPLVRFTFGHIKYVDFALGPPNAVLVELSYDNQNSWSIPTRWNIDPGTRTREVVEIPLNRVLVTAVRLTFIPGTFTFNNDAQTVANKFAIDEVSFYQAPDPCAVGPCANNAGCASEREQFVCQCTTGYTGATCSAPIDRCAQFPMPCLNGGTCVFQPPPASYQCNCVPGFEGDNCESELDPCANRPCGVNGTCSKIGFNMFKCTCAPGFTGVTCVPQSTVEGQIPVASLQSIFEQLDARVVKMEDAGDALLAAKLKMEKQRAQILAQGRQTYRNILGLEQAPSADPNAPPGAFETIAASLFGAGGGANGGLNFPSPGTDSLLGGDASYYPEIADPIFGTDPNGQGPGVGAQVDPYQTAQDPNSLISLYVAKQPQYPPGLQKESLEAIQTAAALAATEQAGTPASSVVHDMNREFPIQTPNVAMAAGPLFNQPYSGGPSYIPTVGGPGGPPVIPPSFDSLDTMIKNLEAQLKVPNTIVYLPNNGQSSTTTTTSNLLAETTNNGLIETSSSIHPPSSDVDEINHLSDMLLLELQSRTHPKQPQQTSRALLSEVDAQTEELSIDLDDFEDHPAITPEEELLALRLQQAQELRERHREAEQNMKQLEKKISSLQERMEKDVGAEVVHGDQDSYVTALLTINSQVKQHAASSQSTNTENKQQKPPMTVEEMNSLADAANRPFPRSGPARWAAQYQQAFPGLDNDVVVNKVATPERIARATPVSASPATTSTPTAAALLQSATNTKPGVVSASSSPPNPAEQRALLQKTLQALIQTRSKLLEQQEHKQMQQEMDSLDPKQQEQVVRGELMRLLGQVSTVAQPEEGSLAEVGEHTNAPEGGGGGGALPGLGAMDVLAAAADPEIDQNDGQLTALASIADSLSAEIPKVAAAQQTPDQLKAAAALKRAQELKYLTQELNVLDPDHKIGELPEDGPQW